MITRLEHVALSVSDMKTSLAFYRDLLGLTVLREIEPGMLGKKLGTVTGMPNCQARIAHLDLGGTMLELFQYLDPEGRPQLADRQQADNGLIHIGFTSTDTRSDYQRLAKLGVEFISEPTEIRSDVWIAYFLGPDREVCEIRENG